MVSSVSDLWRSSPSTYSTSSSSASQSIAARWMNCRFTSLAASKAAKPDLYATPLPPDVDVNPTESVSPTVGMTSSIGSPSVSANIWAMAVREPPMSMLPSMRLTVAVRQHVGDGGSHAGVIAAEAHCDAAPPVWSLKRRVEVIVCHDRFHRLLGTDGSVHYAVRPTSARGGDIEHSEFQSRPCRAPARSRLSGSRTRSRLSVRPEHGMPRSWACSS